VNLDLLTPGTDLYSAVLAHEFQHMIQWHQNRGEDGWVEEGLSELAMTLNGYPTDGSEMAFDLFPDTQLNAWTDEMGRSPVHYGAAYLFAAFFYDRFGAEALRSLATAPRTGIAGFQAALEPLGLDFDTFFRQWVVANVVQGGEQRLLPFGSAPYARRHGTVRMARTLERYPARGRGAVHQYGTDYFLLSPPDDGPVDLSIRFDGSSRTRLAPTFPAEGRAFWYSGRGNQRDITLTRAVDLRGVDQATLTFHTWYQIEDGWDFGYVAVSTDGGRSWTLLRGRHMSDKNPMGNNYGWGYTGVSGGRKGDEPRWVEERIDLGAYAGREVLLRFEYVTDDAYHATGWALDDIAIPEIGFRDGAEEDDLAWEARGFVRCTNFVPQRFAVQLVEWRAGEIRVRPVPLDAENRGTVELRGLGREVAQAILAISAATPITTEWGYYTYQVLPLDEGLAAGQP
ncbi:MAG: immune inhibitor A, partial [Anaerolineae bacterium]|nr:immune inhibitor A [Anaerolineae bacterium]